MSSSAAPAGASDAGAAPQSTSLDHLHATAPSAEQPGPAEVDRSNAPSPSMSLSAGAVGDAAATTSATRARSDVGAPASGGPAASAAGPSTPTRSSPTSASTVPPAEAADAAEQPQTASPVQASAVDSSPTSARSASSSPTASPSSSASQSPSGGVPSRRVKVYRLKDDAWIDLGTGTCSGVFVQPPPLDDDGDDARMLPEEEEGAWIVVRRERTRRDGSESPTGKKGKRARVAGEDAMLSGTDADGSPKKRDQDEDEEPLEEEVILKTRVQPYPPGYTPEDLLDEEELTTVDDNGNTTVDAGGYQRQQDTLIVWTERSAVEGEEEQEMALSFATPSGCGEMWEFIKAARRFAAEQQGLLHSPSPSPSEGLSSPRPFPLNGPSSASLASALPEPTLGSIPHIEDAVRALSRTAVGRERAASVIVRTGYIEKLVKVQQEAEDLESLEDLHALCRVMQSIFLLNDNAIFEHVLRDEMILGVVGVFEYDPEFPTMRASYREHLSSPTAFIPVVPPSLLPASLLAKIHQTHRLHYLKDVVLARILEDSTFSMLNSAIYFNEVDIVNEIAGERELMREVFRILDEDADELSAPTPTPTTSAKGKERDLALGPKRTLGPSLPDDLLDARPSKTPRLSSPPASSSSAPQIASTAPAATPTDPTTLSARERKLHAALFLQQLSQMAKNLQLPVRTSFFKTLSDRGLLRALEGALRFAARIDDGSEAERDDARRMRQAALGVWMTVVDLAPMDVRAYCLRQGKELEKRAEEAEALESEDAAAALAREIEDEGKSKEELEEEKREKEEREARRTLLGLLIGTFKEEDDLGLKTQLSEALRSLVDVTGEGGPLSAPPRMRQEDPEAEKFLQFFYDHCVQSLVQPLVDLPDQSSADPPLAMSPAKVALLTHLCDLLCFFIAHHTFRSKYLILSYPALAKAVSRILRPRPRLTRHTHLRLASLRFLRACVARNDDFYNRFLVKHDLVRSVLDTADEEKDKDNLLGSACLEFLEYLRTSNAKALLNHLMDRGGEVVRRLANAKIRTFESLLARWEMNNEPPPLSLSSTSGSEGSLAAAGSGGATSSSMQRQPSAPGWTPRRELEEESYFNTSDDEDEGDSAATPTSLPGPSAELLASASFGSSRRKREPTSNPSIGGASEEPGEPKRPKLAEGAETRAKPGNPLVDYFDDEEEEDAKPSDAVKPEGDELAGGFIRERRGAFDVGPVLAKPTEESSSSMQVDTPPTTNGTTAPPSTAVPDDKGAPPFLPSLGALKRKKEEDDDGELGLLAKKRSSSVSAPPTLTGIAKDDKKPGGFSFSLKAAPSPASSTTAAVPATQTASSGASKPGGFKIALGGLKSKFGGAGGAGGTKQESPESQG
ncbi:Psy2p [Rhodotorula paludigena]|uniref:Psy2p n=1 Tax=Rhodotorula paludigena TaxID=86838 RepID=UPI0031747E50